eukprot:975698-Rhodomonas_salina.2
MIGVLVSKWVADAFGKGHFPRAKNAKNVHRPLSTREKSALTTVRTRKTCTVRCPQAKKSALSTVRSHKSALRLCPK